MASSAVRTRTLYFLLKALSSAPAFARNAFGWNACLQLGQDAASVKQRLRQSGHRVRLTFSPLSLSAARLVLLIFARDREGDQALFNFFERDARISMPSWVGCDPGRRSLHELFAS